jgi:DHA2 family multidrug resistance protein
MLDGVGGFTLFSLLCGLASSLATLILYRVGQGLCGALIMPMGQAIVLATFPRELHAAVTVIWGFGSVVGPVVGPVIGSMIAETYSWRAVFFMIVPPGMIAMGFVWFSLAGNTARTRARLDWTGFLALSIAMTGLQLMIDRGQRLERFESPEIAAYAAIAAPLVWLMHSRPAEF